MAVSFLESWVPDPSAAAYFDSLLSLADEGASGELAGAAAVRFFSKSGLDRAILKTASPCGASPAYLCRVYNMCFA